MLSIQWLNSQTVFINEIHYDNSGGDVNEGWEIAGPAGTDLSCYDIILYNGGNNLQYNTITLSGLIDDEGCGYGAVWFSQASIQNGGPDGIALYNTCTSTLVQFLSYEGSFTAGDGVANGVTSTNIGVVESGSTLTTESLQLTGNGTVYTDFAWQSPMASTNGSINTGQDFCSCTGPVAEPTNEASALAIGNIACVSAQITWTNGADATNSLVVISTSSITGAPTDGTAYNASGGFGSGDQLNAGEYVVYNGDGSSVNVSNLTAGTTYFVTIFEYNGALANCEENYLTGGVSTSFTTLTGCVTSTPQISSILYNSCNGSNEGIDEIFTFSTGSDAIPVDSIVIDYPGTTPGDYCNTTCGTNTNLNNPTYVNDLNTLAGCTVFAYADPIPANSEVMVFTGNPPSTVLDYSSQCGAANLPIYVLFNNNTSTTGRFANGSSTPRELIVSFGNGMSDTVSYIGTSQPVQDGATVNFDAEGNPTYFISNNCIYPLPIELIHFNAQIINDNTVINWATASENNNDYFVLEKSADGINFFPITTINGSGNSTQQINYSHVDSDVSTGISYYRLKQFDFDGKFRYSYAIRVVDNNSLIYYSEMGIHINIDGVNKNYTLNIYNLSGQVVKSISINKNQTINWTTKGFFIVEIPELLIRQKIICN